MSKARFWFRRVGTGYVPVNGKGWLTVVSWSAVSPAAAAAVAAIANAAGHPEWVIGTAFAALVISTMIFGTVVLLHTDPGP